MPVLRILGRAVLTVLAVVMMQRALITRDFSMAYIQQVGSADTPLLYNIAAMWSALEGSILLWALMLGIFTAAVAWRFRDRADDVLVGWALSRLRSPSSSSPVRYQASARRRSGRPMPSVR